ncbi:MAG: response regulator [Xanthomonadales bacterium]|nr:response regulator [Xanthomonadales bacterium]
MTQAVSILLAEDDPVSGAFLGEVLGVLGEVEQVADGARALGRARERRFGLVVLDAGLPGLDGVALARALREDAGAASRESVLLALSAGLGEPLRTRLLDAGCDDALAKPLAAEALLGRARTLLAERGLPTLDDAAALVALGGRAELLARMRGLLAAELPPALALLAGAIARGRHGEAAEVLHRLRASAGFCGAAALAAAVARLERALAGAAGIAPALARLRRAAEELTRVLEE